jgi:putative chitinase
MPAIPFNAIAQQVQQLLKSRGYGLGSSGPNRDGVDGQAGDLTFAAALAELQKGQASAPVQPPMAASAPKVVDLITVELLQVCCPGVQGLDQWVQPIRNACLRFEMNTVRRVAAFIAQIAHESTCFQRTTENLNYSVEALLSKFGRHRISSADAQRYGRTATQRANQEAIANCIYGGTWGAEELGNTQPGDGWLFRGTGPLQVTGRDNITRFAKAMGMTLTEALQYARTVEGGIMAAAWFWEENDINRLADTPGVNDESKAINGGTNGLEDRRNKFDALVAYLLKKGA